MWGCVVSSWLIGKLLQESYFIKSKVAVIIEVVVFNFVQLSDYNNAITRKTLTSETALFDNLLYILNFYLLFVFICMKPENPFRVQVLNEK